MNLLVENKHEGQWTVPKVKTEKIDRPLSFVFYKIKDKTQHVSKIKVN